MYSWPARGSAHGAVLLCFACCLAQIIMQEAEAAGGGVGVNKLGGGGFVGGENGAGWRLVPAGGPESAAETAAAVEIRSLRENLGVAVEVRVGMVVRPRGRFLRMYPAGS